MTSRILEKLNRKRIPLGKFITLLSCLVAIIMLFTANSRYVYSDDLDQLPRLTASHIADPKFAGSTFRFEGLASNVRTLQSGLMIIKLRNAKEDLHIDVAVFPSVGCLPVKPTPGESVRVTGNLGMYKGRPQIKPLSAMHVEVTTPGGDAVSLSEVTLMKRVGETLRVGPLIATTVDPFTSRRGLQHVRLTFADSQLGVNGEHATVQGIMFQGDRTDCEIKLLSSGTPVVLTAKVDAYKGRPSLVVKRVLAIN